MKPRVLLPTLLSLMLLAHGAFAAEAAPAPAPARADTASAPLIAVMLPDFAALVRGQGPVVVNIRAFRARPASTTRGQSSDSAVPPPRETGVGSGFVVAPNGIILTNSHVIRGADKINVRFADKRELAARVIGFDPLTDVAVLKVEADNLPTAMLGDSTRLEVGQWVLAIGAPLGLERTATQGIISALGRSLPSDSYVPFIQTDVPINPGNSGGPLFDTRGRVVGINSQIVTHTGGYMGLSFAIPINTAVAVARQILEQGRARHGWLGVSAQELSQELAHAYGLELPHGALLTEIKPGGPAAKAGLLTGDIVLALDGVAVIDSADLPPMIGACVPGSEHLLAVLREGQPLEITVTVGELGATDNTAPPRLTVARLGVQISDMEGGGILVEGVAPGAAAAAGIQPGDILLKLGRQPLENAAQFLELSEHLKDGLTLPILIRRQDDLSFLPLAMPMKATPTPSEK
ncbi:MAG: trypsin-like peptidase domain-containing protein [Pseudomonadota bacterium]|nr:trypsin-like peptidase domain-containing protein [Pseudomonadota bacterium]MDP2351312.1 trypsin-like peptidase domain-containing protein [Pseudomonadota bacterium]